MSKTKCTEYIIEWLTPRGRPYSPRQFYGSNTAWTTSLRMTQRYAFISGALIRQGEMTEGRSRIVPVNCEVQDE